MLYENTAIAVPSIDFGAPSEATDRESDVWQQTDHRQSPRPKILPIYISWYINGYG